MHRLNLIGLFFSIFVYCRNLAATYECEALCSLGRVEEAMTLLLPHYKPNHPPSTDTIVSTALPALTTMNIPRHYFTDNSYPIGLDRGVESVLVSTAEANSSNHTCSIDNLVSTVNYASALALQGDLNKSQIILEGLISTCPTFIPSIKLLVYVLLRKGRPEEAIAALRSFRIS